MDYERDRVIESIVAAARSEEAVRALWECGSAAFDRTDEYSDIDMGMVVESGKVEAVVEVIRFALSSIAKISNERRQRTYHGDAQFFWQFEAFPFNYVDIDLIERKEDGVRINRSTEGEPIIHFDKCGCISVVEETPEERKLRVSKRVTEIARVFEIHPVLVKKHIRRGHVLQAYGEYQRFMIRPLIELLRIKHCPQRSSWHTTYIAWDLPLEVNERLRPLVMVDGLEQMDRNLVAIQAWVKKLIQEVAGSCPCAAGDLEKPRR